MRRRWAIIVVAVALCVGAAVAYVSSATPKYRSQVQLFVATQQSVAQSNLDLQQGGQFTQGRVLSYVDLVTSTSVTDAVVADLGLRMTPAEVAAEVSASVPADTVLIDIAVTDSSPARAREIASAVASQVIRLVRTLEGPGRGASPVRVSVANPAQTPTTPASPRKKLDILLGVLAGLVIGFALAILRDHADNSVSDVDELKDHWDQPVLAVVPNESGSKSYKGAARSAKALAGRSEALRHLRTSLNFIDVDHPPDSVVITSSVPGEGKSTIALTLAEVVAAAGQTVILVDGDLRRPSIASYAGIPQGNGLSDALLSSGLLSDVLMEHPGYPTLKILQAGSPVPNPSEILSSERMADLLRSLRSLADLVIVDAPPLGLVTDAAILSALTSGALVVVEPRAASRRALRDTLTQLSMVNARVFGLIVNKVRRAGGRYQYDGYAYSQAATGYKASPEPLSEETRIAHEEPPQSPERVS